MEKEKLTTLAELLEKAGYKLTGLKEVRNEEEIYRYDSWVIEIVPLL